MAAVAVVDVQEGCKSPHVPAQVGTGATGGACTLVVLTAFMYAIVLCGNDFPYPSVTQSDILPPQADFSKSEGPLTEHTTDKVLAFRAPVPPKGVFDKILYAGSRHTW